MYGGGCGVNASLQNRRAMVLYRREALILHTILHIHDSIIARTETHFLFQICLFLSSML